MRFAPPLAFAAVLTAACVSTKVQETTIRPYVAHLAPSRVIPQARGNAWIGLTSNGNVSLDLLVQGLPDPARLRKEARVYVVWLRPLDRKAPMTNLGALRINNLGNGALSTVTPWRTFDVFITAEGSSELGRPTGRPLMGASVGMGPERMEGT